MDFFIVITKLNTFSLAICLIHNVLPFMIIILSPEFILRNKILL